MPHIVTKVINSNPINDANPMVAISVEVKHGLVEFFSSRSA